MEEGRQMIERLPFKPLFGLGSPHLQMMAASLSPIPKEPPWELATIDVFKGKLTALVSTPTGWTSQDKSVILIHGLGGSAHGGYLVRIASKLFARGIRTIRVNLRGVQEGENLSELPYHSGRSDDIREVIAFFKDSPLYVIGFSLGGNLILKMGGERELPVRKLIAVSPVLNLKSTQKKIASFKILPYEAYFLKHMETYSKKWTEHLKIQSILDFDERVIAPLWGFKNAQDYYSQSSSLPFIPKIKNETQILMAKDDPFIDYSPLLHVPLPKNVHVYLTEHGSHMAFIGDTKKIYNYFWMDETLQNWILYD